MIIAFASKNHLGLNSDVGKDIYNSEYFTIVEINEEGKLIKVKNVENKFYNIRDMEPGWIIDLMKDLKVEKFFINQLENDILKNEFIKNNILIKENISGRIADILKNLNY
jgi:hypothetical protein